MAAVVDLDFPGMEVAAGPGRWLHLVRTDANRWVLAVGDDETVGRVLAADAAGLAPSEVMARARAALGARRPRLSCLAHVELDRCGTWVTMCTPGGPRPVVVRRAGWVDVRGHPANAVADDRVGLGPGDSLVVFPHDDELANDDGVPPARVLDDLLAVCGRGAAAQLAAIVPAAPCAGVLAVPPDLGADPLARVAGATGVPAAELHLPGYPLGDAQPDLWSEPPLPPREARLRVDRDPTDARRVRDLLRRLVASWRLEDRIAGDDLLLLATEVTANAILHSGTAATAIVRYLGDHLRIEVGDGSPAAPTVRPVADAGASGRGMFLVDALSDSWGVIPTEQGKRVWFEVPIATGPASAG